MPSGASTLPAKSSSSTSVSLIGAIFALAAYLYLGMASIDYSTLLCATLIAGIAYPIVITAAQAWECSGVLSIMKDTLQN
jgi:hypothetical protein